jgi:hypothetical protein
MDTFKIDDVNPPVTLIGGMTTEIDNRILLRSKKLKTAMTDGRVVLEKNQKSEIKRVQRLIAIDHNPFINTDHRSENLLEKLIDTIEKLTIKLDSVGMTASSNNISIRRDDIPDYIPSRDMSIPVNARIQIDESTIETKSDAESDLRKMLKKQT